MYVCRTNGWMTGWLGVMSSRHLVGLSNIDFKCTARPLNVVPVSDVHPSMSTSVTVPLASSD